MSEWCGRSPSSQGAVAPRRDHGRGGPRRDAGAERRPPRRSRRLAPRGRLDALSDDLVLRVFLRAPFATHGTLRCVGRRLRALLGSDAFAAQRREAGLEEHALLVAGGIRAGGHGATAECWMLARRACRPVAPLPRGPRYDACSVVVDDELWVLGGRRALDLGGAYARSAALDTVEAYDARANAWRSCAPMRRARTGFVAGVVGGRLVVAGHGGDADAASAEALGPGGWAPIPPMPHEAHWATACAWGGKLYVCGGIGCDKLQVLTTQSSRPGSAMKLRPPLSLSFKVLELAAAPREADRRFVWTVRADLPGGARSHAASVARDGRVWLVGGLAQRADGTMAASTTVLVYDVERDAWREAAPHPDRNSDHCAAELDGEIVTFGLGQPARLRDGGGGWERAPLARAPHLIYSACAAGLLLG